jgi:HEPN domain-containing protein
MQKHEIWLALAEDDLKVATLILNSNEIILGPVFFHIQQCVEKALKSYLIFKRQNVRRTHDLVVLVENCMEFDAEFSIFLKDAADLTPYASETRYPDACFVMPDVSTAKIDMGKADKILEFVRRKTAY